MKQTPVNKKDNHLTISLLAKLGNAQPNQLQIQLAYSLLIRSTVNQQITLPNILTKREASCLLLAAKGKTITETAELLNVKASTVKTWRKNINQKLACSSTAHAIFEAIRFGYIHNYEPKF